MGSVRRVVARAHRTVVGVRVVESMLLGVGAALFVGCVLELQDVEARGSELAWLAAVAFTAAAGAWFAGHGTSRGRVVAAADRRLGWRGALRTAFEVEARPEPTRIEALLVERVRADLRPRAVRSAVAPNSVPVIAVPFLALALFASVRGDEERTSDAASKLVQRAVGELDGAGLELADDDELAGEWSRARSRAQLLSEELENGVPAAELDQEWAELDGSLSQLARRVEPNSALAGEVARARESLDAARLTGDEVEGGDADAGAAAAGEGDGGEGSGGSASSASPQVESAVPDSGRAPSEAPSGAGRWWPARHDEVVRAWVERSRAERSRGE